MAGSFNRFNLVSYYKHDSDNFEFSDPFALSEF
jgi:hypothetical protein